MYYKNLKKIKSFVTLKPRGSKPSGFFYLFSFQNGIKQCEEGDRCHRSAYDIADWFCEEYCKYFIVEEIRQDKDQRYQQDNLTKAGKRGLTFARPRAIKLCWRLYLETKREDSAM